MPAIRIGFAGDRDIAVWVLKFLLNEGVKPTVLMLSAPSRASHKEELRALCPFLTEDRVLIGQAFRTDSGMTLLKSLELDYILSIHFPYIVPKSVLEIPHYGVLNLHPAYLPFNRGWHTPSWALLEGTPIGATLHFMDEGVDTGDIIFRKELRIAPDDTAHSLYGRLKELEYELFRESWSQIAAGTYQRVPQLPHEGTRHKKEELFSEAIQRIDLEERIVAGDLLRRLRALTTNSVSEAAYYEIDGKRYRVQVHIQEDDVL